MRVIGAGLAVFLTVTVILLYQISTDGNDPVAVAVGVSPEATETATAPLPLSPTSQPTRALPTATMTVALPTATPTTIAPVTAPAIDEEIEELHESEPVVIDSDASEEPEVEATVETDTSDESVVALAGIDASDVRSGAIETPNGGVIGMIASGLANVRSMPTVDAPVIDELHAGWPVAIYGATVGETVSGSDVWYQVSGGYISAALVQPFVPSDPDVYYEGHWIDVDLTRNVAVAYVDATAINAVTIISGKPGFETPLGAHTVFARVENETLDSATVGIPMGDPEYYYLPDVPYTQYFAAGGFAIHANYWSDSWQYGTDSSHGCVNMFVEDAAWFWWFLEIGSVVNVHF